LDRRPAAFTRAPLIQTYHCANRFQTHIAPLQSNTNVFVPTDLGGRSNGQAPSLPKDLARIVTAEAPPRSDMDGPSRNEDKPAMR
jgi:hypothetical protein